MQYPLAQLIGFIAFIISLIAYQKKQKSKLFITMIISSILKLVHYLLLNAYSGCLTKFMAILRDSIIVLKEKYKFLSSYIFLIILILGYITIGYLSYTGILSLLPILAATIYLLVIWNGNIKNIKITSCLTYILWLIYNIYVSSIAGIISNIISIISIIISLYKTKEKS